MSATRSLASYAARLKYEDLPPSVVERGKLALLDAVGNTIGGYALPQSGTFLGLAKDLGGGREQATLIGDGARVSVPLAAFGNGALGTMLDFCDDRGSGRSYAWLGALAVPAALAAGEARSISGKELITSVVAGYEVCARILHSMDMTFERFEEITGETSSVFASAAAAGRALGLDEDGMLSNLSMAGIYTPVASGRKWMGDDGLRPMKEIKQGWAWMCMIGAFTAVSAQAGLKSLQENNVLDGDKGLWRMLGYDTFREEVLTEGFGEKYYIPEFGAKLHPGCTITHPAIVTVKGLVSDHGIDPGNIEKIDVYTNKGEVGGFDDQEPVGVADMQFSIPYQVSAGLLAGDPGPNWYLERTRTRQDVSAMARLVSLASDDECEEAYRKDGVFLTKVAVATKAGERYEGRLTRAPLARSADEIKKKFVTTASQVTGRDQVDKILGAIENLESLGNVSQLIDLLWLPPPRR